MLHFIASPDAARLKAQLRERIADAEKTNATAPLGAVWRTVLTELEAADTPDAGAAPAPAPPADRLLTAAEAAHRLGVSISWLYDRWRAEGLGVKVGDHFVRFPESKLAAYVARRARAGP